MTFPELVTAGLLLLAQTRPDLAHEAHYVHIYQSNPDSPFLGFFDLEHPENIWINSENAYNEHLMRAALAHELTHHQDWRLGKLTDKTCGEEFFQAEYRATKAQMDWQPWADTVMLNFVRAQPSYQKPCQEAA